MAKSNGGNYKNDGQAFPKGSNYPYTSIAKNAPEGKTKAGVDNWHVVGGQPEDVGRKDDTSGRPEYYHGKSTQGGK